MSIMSFMLKECLLSFFDLFAIREGLSPKAKHEKNIEEKKAKEEEEKRAKAEAEQLKKEIEEGQAEAIMDNDYEKKYGTVTSGRGHDKKARNKQDWDNR